MVHTVELNWGKPLYHTPPPFPISQDAKWCVSTAMFDPTVKIYWNVLHFKPE